MASPQRVFTLICTDDSLCFPLGYFDYISQCVADYRTETQGDSMDVPFAREEIQPFIDFTASLVIEAKTKEEWKHLFTLADYFQLTPRYEQLFAGQFMAWCHKRGHAQYSYVPTLVQCRRKLKNRSYRTDEEKDIIRKNEIRKLGGPGKI